MSPTGPSLIEQIKDRIRLMDLITEAGVQLRQEGAEWAGLCPFHSDSDPSFKVYTADDGAERFKCFGCDAGGDTLDFWARYRGLTPQVAIEELADRAGLMREEQSGRPQARKIQKPPQNAQPADHNSGQNATGDQVPPVGALSPLEGMVNRAQETLQRHPEVLTYLQEQRRLTPEIIAQARLGYEANQGRVVIPVPRPDGQVERARLYDWQKRSPGRKIIWGPGTGKPGLYPSWALQAESLLLVEGELDALCAWSLGVPAITGTAGAKRFPRDWAGLLTGKQVVVCYDVDPQGEEGALRAARVLAGAGIQVRLLRLPLEYRQKGDPKDLSDWVLAGGTQEQLEQLMASAPAYQPGPNLLNDAGGRDGSPVLEQLDDAPVGEEAVSPPGWRLRRDGLFEVKTTGDGELKLSRVLPLPVVITSRVRNLETGGEQVELAFARDGHWRRLMADRDLAADKGRIVRLASRGLLVNSNNARAMVQYLADYEAVNIDEIPEQAVVGTCGLKRVHGETVFVAGAQVITSAGITDTTDTTDTQVRFVAEDGDWQLVNAITPAGTASEWERMVRQAQQFPRVMFCLYAAFVPPLMPILDIPNFIVELCHDTSAGKSTTTELAASAWGRPGGMNGLVKAWNQTKVFAERYATLMNHLPIFLDDSQTADQRTVSSMLYLIANGIGRGRGAKAGGVQHTGHWRTVCLSTGESPLTGSTEFGGARARTITLWGSPFGPTPQGEKVRELKSRAATHHGHAGPRFVQELLAIQNQWDKLRELYHLRTRQLADQQPGNVADRMSRYLAAIWVAGDLVHQLLGLPGDAEEIVQTVTSEVSTEIQDSDYAVRALELVRGWVHASMERFWEKGDSTRPAQEYLGVWRDADYESDRFIAIFTHQLKRFLKDQGFDYTAILRQWRERDWIRTQNGRMTAPVRYRGGVAKMIVLKWSAWAIAIEEANLQG